MGEKGGDLGNSLGCHYNYGFVAPSFGIGAFLENRMSNPLG